MLVALFRTYNNKKNKKRDNNNPQSAAHRAGPLVVFCDEFLRNSSSVRVDNRTDSVYVSISLSVGVFSGRRGVCADCCGLSPLTHTHTYMTD